MHGWTAGARLLLAAADAAAATAGAHPEAASPAHACDSEDGRYKHRDAGDVAEHRRQYAQEGGDWHAVGSGGGLAAEGREGSR